MDRGERDPSCRADPHPARRV
ncbi:hypothetical protein, partial [Microbacterium sp. H6]